MENSNEFDGPKHIDSPADVKGDYEIVANIWNLNGINHRVFFQFFS
jgi:hypothetical protein